MSTEQTDKDKLEAIKCTSCGGDLAKSYRIEYEDDDEEHIPIAKCMSCSKEYDQYTQEYYALFADDLTYDKENTVFQLGDKGTIEGVEYEIIGRLRFQEEEEYEKTTWDEWLAISSEGAYHYFVEEDGKVYSYEDYVPNSIDLESSSSFIELDGRKYPKNDAYIGRVVLAEGELPYEAEIGEAVTCYDIKKDGIKYTIEQTENEVTITKGDNISYDAIIKAFGDEKEQELYAKTMAKRKEFKKKSIVYLVATLFAFFMSCHNCMYEKPVKGVMKGQKILSANKYQRDKKGYYFTSQVIYGPFNVKKAHTLYEIDVRVDESIQRLRHEWQSFRLMIIRKDRLQKLLSGVNVDQTEKKKEDKKQDKKKETKKTTTTNWGSSGRSTGSTSN